ncbi:hypothetical protein DSO57_1017317 [Entomophthora muscae]|uniref:Uncharacterized protein n=1 Tax=Entomophthora muscae TaxID=34485 RepID=A0ACC2S708_9FUNG|nr:hypothetical protein DSO57_1017317 [Entomophthora muscae]
MEAIRFFIILEGGMDLIITVAPVKRDNFLLYGVKLGTMAAGSYVETEMFDWRASEHVGVKKVENLCSAKAWLQ